MPAHDSIASQARPLAGRPWQGYGLLAVAWLLFLAAVALAGWFVHASGQGERPVHTATLYSDAVPSPPEPAAQPLTAQAIGPRIRQLAARDAQAPVPQDDRADAVARPPQSGARRAPSAPPSSPVPAIPDAIGGFDDRGAERPAPPPADRLAARRDATDADTTGAGPLPPPVPRSIVATAAGWPDSDSAARYSVQVGAFRMRDNAVERAARLSEAGYDVRIVHAFATHSRLYMVRLGGFDARPAAMAYAQRLARDVDVETWPVRN